MKSGECEFLQLRSKLLLQAEHISFEAETHRYFNQAGESYFSVSDLLAAFLPKFDRETISKTLAAREKKSPQEIQARWEVQRDYSTVRGTEFHLYVETFLKEGRSLDPITPIEKEIAAFHAFWDNRNEMKYNVVATELILTDEERKIAGTIDCLAVHYKTGNFFLFDWKTNRAIRERNYFNRKLKAPLSQLDDCELVRYSLKMKVYKALLEKKGVPINGEFLIHFSPMQAPHPGAKPYRIIPCLPLEREAEQLLQAFFKNKESEDKKIAAVKEFG